MNKKGEINIGLLMVMIFIFFMAAWAFSIVIENREINERRQFCIDKLGERTYYPNIVGKNHINCCWKEVFLNDKGFYENRKCIGLDYELKNTWLNRLRSNIN